MDTRLNLAISLVLLAASAVLASASAQAEYGVGFSLASSYGYVQELSAVNPQCLRSFFHSVTSIYFRNGTFIDVAKVQGGVQYQKYMSQVLSGFAMNTVAECPLPEWLCRFWPAPPNPLSPMIFALKTSTETALEQNLSAAEIAIPHLPDQRDTITSGIAAALRGASLQYFRSPTWNGKYAATHLPLRDNCSSNYDPNDPLVEDDPPQVVLTVEYTQSSLTAVLWEDDCRLFTAMRKLYSEDLGKAGLDDCRNGNTQTRDNCNRELHDVLQQLTKLPATCEGSSYDQIDWVVVFGEASDDSNLHEVLQDVLGEGYSGSVLARNSSPQTFAASSGVARLAWQLADSVAEASSFPKYDL